MVRPTSRRSAHRPRIDGCTTLHRTDGCEIEHRTSRAVEIICSRLAPQVLQRLPGQLLRGNLVVLTSRIERRRQDRRAEKRYAADFFFRGRVRVRSA